MKKSQRRTIVTLSALAAALAGLGVASQVIGASTPAPAAVAAAPAATYSPLPGMPPLVDPKNVYGSIASSNMSPVVKDHLRRVYVPNLRSNDVYVIDQDSLKVVDKFKVGSGPQHVVPSWDLRTLWVANNAERTDKGSLTPVDPLTGKPGKEVPVDDPYNTVSYTHLTLPTKA